jgi:iron(III) transport system permease protein
VPAIADALRPASAPVVPRVSRSRDATRPLAVAAGLLAVVVLLPLAAIAWNAATPRVDVWMHLVRTQLGGLAFNTVALLLGVGALVAIIGVGLAWLVATRDFPGRGFFEWALVLPLAMPAYVVGFVLLGMFDYAGPVARLWQAIAGADARLPDVRSYGGVVIVMALVYYPYVYLLTRTAFAERSASLIEAARGLGLRPRQTFLHLAVPIARPAIAAGLALALMETLADFGTVSLFGYQTFTVAVYRVWFGMFDRVAAGQLATVLLLFAAIVLGLERWARRSARFSLPSGGTAPKRATLGRSAGWMATGVCSSVLGIAFVLPTSVLVVWSARAVADGASIQPLWRQAANTALVGVGAMAVCLAAALLLAYAARLVRSRVIARLGNVALLGYAIPGTVVAVGVIGVLAAVDRAVAGAADLLGVAPPPLLATSAIGLLFAYVVRFLAVSYLPIQAGLARVGPALDESARSLGASPLRLLTNVHAPLLRGALVTAGVLVLVDVMKELPATMLLRPFGFDTLAVGIWQATTESLWLQAAPPALAIVIVGTVLVLMLTRGFGRTMLGPVARTGAAR